MREEDEEDYEEEKRQREEEYETLQGNIKKFTTIEYPENWDDMDDTGTLQLLYLRTSANLHDLGYTETKLVDIQK